MPWFGSQEEAEQYRLTGPLVEGAIPATLQDSLMGVAGAIKSRSFIIALHINKLWFYAQR